LACSTGGLDSLFSSLGEKSGSADEWGCWESAVSLTKYLEEAL